MLPKKTCLLFFGFFLLFYANFQSTQAQQWRWAINGSGNNQNSNADRDIAIDNDGTQFIAGYFIDTLSLGSFTRLRENTGNGFSFL